MSQMIVLMGDEMRTDVKTRFTKDSTMIQYLAMGVSFPIAKGFLYGL